MQNSSDTIVKGELGVYTDVAHDMPSEKERAKKKNASSLHNKM